MGGSLISAKERTEIDGQEQRRAGTPDRATGAAPPRGFRDILPAEARELRAIERRLAERFDAYGYVPLDPPSVEHGEGAAALAGGRVIRFLDRDGSLLALRPDLTTAIARLVAQRYAEARGALRLSYFAPVFREEPAMLGTEREYVQAGVELIGPSGALADAEALALLAESLTATGLRDHTIEVGHIGSLGALFAELTDADRARAISLLRGGDHAGAIAHARDAGMSSRALSRARRALAARGMDELEDVASTCFEPLREVIALAETMSGERCFVPNLAVIPALPYYTGVVFEAVHADQGFAIATGGRYDLLVGAFGLSRPATGFAIDIPRLHLALFASGWRPRDEHSLVALALGAADATARAAATLRGLGVAVALGDVAESAGLPVLAASLEGERLRLADGRLLTPAELARELA